MEAVDTIQLLGQLIGSLGFPIVMSILLFRHLEKEQDSHKQEVSSLKDAINDLRITLAGIRSFMSGSDGGQTNG